MTYQQALKKALAEKKEALVLVQFGYANRIVMLSKDAAVLLDCLSKGEQLITAYSDRPRLTSLEESAFSVTPFPFEKYQDIRVSMLLDIPLSSAQHMREGPPQETT